MFESLRDIFTAPFFTLYWMDGGNVYVFLLGLIDLCYYHYYNSFFALLQMTIWQNGVWHKHAYKTDGTHWFSPWGNWHSSTIAEYLGRPKSNCEHKWWMMRFISDEVIWDRERESATGYFYARVHKNGGRVSNSNADCDIHLTLTPLKRYIIKNLHGMLKPWSNLISRKNLNFTQSIFSDIG